MLCSPQWTHAYGISDPVILLCYCFQWGISHTVLITWVIEPRWRTLHLASLNPICHFWCQSTNRFSSSWSCRQSSWEFIPWKSLVSSANIFAVYMISSGGYLMQMTNRIGQSTLPCGVSLRIPAQVDNLPFTTTRCHLAVEVMNPCEEAVLNAICPKFLN